jgi:hypothetical protein
MDAVTTGTMQTKEEKALPARTDRRKFLKYLGVAAAGVAVGTAVGRYARIPPPSSTETVLKTTSVAKPQPQTVTETLVYPASLRAAAEARGLLIGSEAHDISVEDARFEAALTREFNSLTVGR